MYMEIYVCYLIFFSSRLKIFSLYADLIATEIYFFSAMRCCFFYNSGNAKIPGKNNFGGDFLSVIALLS